VYEGGGDFARAGPRERFGIRIEMNDHDDPLMIIAGAEVFGAAPVGGLQG